MFSRSHSHQRSTPSLLSSDLHLLGNIFSEGTVDIEGKITGNVTCGVLIVRPNGKVMGDVMAETVHVHGEVEGTIQAQTVQLYASARVQGLIMHKTLMMEEGASFEGNCKRLEKSAGERALIEEAKSGNKLLAQYKLA